MSKKAIISIVLLLLLVGWVVLVHVSHDPWFRNCMWGAGVWFLVRFFFRGIRQKSFSKRWDISFAIVELVLIGLLIGSINLTAVNVQAAPSNLWNFLKGTSTVQYDWIRVWLIVLEMLAPAILGVIFGGMCRKQKQTKQ